MCPLSIAIRGKLVWSVEGGSCCWTGVTGLDEDGQMPCVGSLCGHISEGKHLVLFSLVKARKDIERREQKDNHY